MITILDGEGALNDIRQRTAREPIIQVEDENHKPIAGAAVLFALPGSGPGGAFAEGAQTFSTVTDSAGRAVAHGLRPNSVSGSYNIHVRVTFNGSTSETEIHQQNISGHSSTANHVAHAATLKTVLIVVAAAAAAGTVAAILVTQGGSSTTITVAANCRWPPTSGVDQASAFSLHLSFPLRVRNVHLEKHPMNPDSDQCTVTLKLFKRCAQIAGLFALPAFHGTNGSVHAKSQSTNSAGLISIRLEEQKNGDEAIQRSFLRILSFITEIFCAFV